MIRIFLGLCACAVLFFCWLKAGVNLVIDREGVAALWFVGGNVVSVILVGLIMWLNRIGDVD